MAITVSNTYYTATSTGASSLTIPNVVIPAGTTSLWVTISHSQGADAIVPATGKVVFNTTETMTRAAASFTNVGAYIYYLANPTATTANVVITFTGATDRGIVATAIVVSGSLTTGVLGATQTAQNGSATAISATINPTQADNSVILDCVTTLDQFALTQDVGQTQIISQWQAGNPQGCEAGASYKTTTTAGSYTTGWDNTGTNTQWDYVAVEIKPFTTSIKTVDGLAIASVKTSDGLATASIKTINGLA